MPMTDAPPSTTGLDAAADPTTCAACPHRWGAHDPIGRRFCSATTAGGSARGCACVSTTPLA